MILVGSSNHFFALSQDLIPTSALLSLGAAALYLPYSTIASSYLPSDL